MSRFFPGKIKLRIDYILCYFKSFKGTFINNVGPGPGQLRGGGCKPNEHFLHKVNSVKGRSGGDQKRPKK